MKHLLRVLFILALFCGVSSSAHAASVNFHTQILDPSCDPANTSCGVSLSDVGVPFPIALSMGLCTSHTPPVTGLPTDGTPFGCFVGTNNTGSDITSFTLDFNNPGLTGGSCDTTLPGQVTPSPAFGLSGCSVDPAGGFDLTFSGGSIANSNQFIILEIGADPNLFTNGTVTVGETPEPSSLILFSTGAMMMVGAFFVKRQHQFGIPRK